MTGTRDAYDDAAALELAARALHARDVSAAVLERTLAKAGFDAETRQRVLARLREAGFLDDARLACTRARSLAGRGWGDAAIDSRLAEAGVGADDRSAALATLEPEALRAARLAAARGEDARRSARFLARRGFSSEAVEAALGSPDTLTCPELP